MITLACIFYNQHKMLPLHIAAWATHPKDVFLYSIIDDASPIPVPVCIARDTLTVYRVQQDIPWNIAGARNLAFHTAKTEWVFCSDIDHVVTKDSALAISQLNLEDPRVVYTFRRIAPDGYYGVDAIINILMNREKFFEIGGYDEDFSGGYGREEVFFQDCLKHHKLLITRCDHIVLQWRRDIGSTTALSRDKSGNARLYERKKSELKSGVYKKGRRIRFDWKVVM
jgi:hypothetical protein